MLKVAFIGTGIMGSHMAKNIAKAGHGVRVWNRTREKADAIASGRIAVSASAAEAAKGASHVVLMLSDGKACDHVLSDMGVYDAAQKGAMVVVMSSTDVNSARNQAKECAQRDIAFLDAPVSGGEKGAREATLKIMAGGEPKHFEQAQELFECMGQPVLVGPAGSGQLAKLVNQNIVALTILSVAESFVLAEKAGLDLAKVREALSGGFADSTVLRQHALRMINDDFKPGGPAKHQLKDLRNALKSAEELQVDMPMLRHAEAIFAKFVEKGGGEMDHSGIIELLRGRME